MAGTLGPAPRAPSLRGLLADAARAVRARPSIFVLPALAFSVFQARTLLVARAMGASVGAANAVRVPHGVPGVRPLVSFALDHVEAVPAVGTFVLLVVAEGVILWRARRDATQLGEPRAGLGDPRALALLWLAAFALFAVGAILGFTFGGERPRTLAFLLVLPAAAMTQALFTAQLVLLLGAPDAGTASPDRRPSWPDATRAASPVLPRLIAWEAVLALGFFAALRIAGAAHVARLGTMGALAVRAALAWVPVALVVDAAPLGATLRAQTHLWRRRLAGAAVPLALLGAAFAIYGLAGAVVEARAAVNGETSRIVVHTALGYGALLVHLVGAACLIALYRQRLSPLAAVEAR